MQKSKSSGKASLRPRARILRTFGDELISSDAVALIELVKNAYDADATLVAIRFEGDLQSDKGVIEVIDNGHGMDLETIQSTWMEPATLYRKRKLFSEGLRRRVLGEKGIGRFASSRLANILEVITRKKDSDIETKATFDWTLFDNEDMYLDQIEVEWEERRPLEVTEDKFSNKFLAKGDKRFRAKPHGTILRMTGNRNPWDNVKIKELKRDLSRLVSPFMEEYQKISASSFTISLELPEPYQEFSGNIEPSEIIGKPHYTLKGSVDKSGKHSFSLKLRGRKKAKKIAGKFTLEDGRKPESGGFDIEFRVWDRDPVSLRDLASTYGSTLGVVREDLNNVAGISVYRDGFRVMPYGEKGNDWLRLDHRRFLNPTLRISNNQIVGYVSISGENNPKLKDQSNREGLVDSQALRDFAEILVEVLSLLEAERYKVKPREGKKNEKKGGLFEGFNLKSVQDYAKKKYPKDKALQGLLGEKDSDIKERVDEVQRVLSRYQRLATLGQLIDTVLHDGRGPLSKIKNEAELGARDLRNKKEEIAELIPVFVKRFGGIENNSDILSTLFNRIEPFGGRKRGRPADIRLESIIENAFGVLETEIKETGVVIDLPNGTTIVKVDPAEIQEVFINLLQNSLYWLKDVDKGKRKIKVVLESRVAGELKILFSDSGPGVSLENQEKIFEPYFSTKPNGVGLGLTIAGEVITEFYDGSLELISKGPLAGANFRITLRKRV